MNKKIIVIGGIVVVLIAAALIAFFVGRTNIGSQNGGVNSGTGTLPLTSSTPPITTPAPTGTTITLGTADGSVTMNNFYTAAGTTVTQDGQAVIINNSSNDYAITYNVPDSSFVISLMATPLNAARQEAEAAFLSELGISKADACKLTVYEGVPISVSDQYTGESFPLSFCGGPTSL